MNDLIIHKTSKNFYKDKSYGNSLLSKFIVADSSQILPLIKFECFSDFDWVDAVVTTKLGGVSTGHLGSLNLGDKNGDSPKNVYTNYIRISQALNLPIENFIKTDQVHGTKVSLVTKNHLPAGPKKRISTDVDGLCTDICNTPLCVSIADCIPIFIVSTDIKMIAAVHSGWRGTVGRIGREAIRIMESQGARPECMIGLIGPGISQENYEVTEDVVFAFRDSGFSADQMKDIAYQTDDIHYQLDLWAACWHYLHDAGLKPDNIHISGICTYENHDLLWSHRYTKGKRGNLNGIIWKK